MSGTIGSDGYDIFLMDTKLFETLGKYAGFGGLTIGPALVLFRAIFGKTTLPRDSKEVYGLISQMIYVAFVIHLRAYLASLGSKPRRFVIDCR